jgi:TonB family protein
VNLLLACTLALTSTLVSAQASAQQPVPTAPQTVVDEPISVPPIVYPDDARAQHITGTVQLEISVDPTGKVANVRVLSGPQELRQAAVDAYYGALYHPLMRNGIAVPALVTTGVNFALDATAPPPPASKTKTGALAGQFENSHARCQQQSASHAAEALTTCRQTVALARQFHGTEHLEARAVAYNDLVLLLIQPGKSARKADLAEAGQVADQAINLVNTGTLPGAAPTIAVAIAHVSRAEVRSLSGDLSGAIADCTTAEDTLSALIAAEATPGTAIGGYKDQLRQIYELHAIMLDRQGNRKEAKAVREREAAV